MCIVSIVIILVVLQMLLTLYTDEANYAYYLLHYMFCTTSLSFAVVTRKLLKKRQAHVAFSALRTHMYVSI